MLERSCFPGWLPVWTVLIGCNNNIISLMLRQLSKKYLGSTIPVVNIQGVIRPETTEALVKRLKSIKPSRAVAMAVVVNSPGGLPVQSQLISDKLKNYSAKHNLKMYTFAQDLAASGGYMVLCAGDHVVADRTSVIGSIGVVFQKTQMTGLLHHFNIDPKQFTTQDNLLHGVFSPFQSTNEEAKAYLKKLCEGSHGKFVDYVKKNRGNKLKDDPSTFTGDVFNGPEGLQRGLIDEVGSMVEVLEKRHPGAKLDFEPQRQTLLNRVFSL